MLYYVTGIISTQTKEKKMLLLWSTDTDNTTTSLPQKIVYALAAPPTIKEKRKIRKRKGLKKNKSLKLKTNINQQLKLTKYWKTLVKDDKSDGNDK